MIAWSYIMYVTFYQAGVGVGTKCTSCLRLYVARAAVYFLGLVVFAIVVVRIIDSSYFEVFVVRLS